MGGCALRAPLDFWIYLRGAAGEQKAKAGTGLVRSVCDGLSLYYLLFLL